MPCEVDTVMSDNIVLRIFDGQKLRNRSRAENPPHQSISTNHRKERKKHRKKKKLGDKGVNKITKTEVPVGYP